MGQYRGQGGGRYGGGRANIHSRMNQQAIAQRGGAGPDPTRSAGLRAPVQAQGGYATAQPPMNRGQPPSPGGMQSAQQAQMTAYERAQQPGAILDPQRQGNQMQQQMRAQRAQAGALRGRPPNPTGNRMPMGGGRYGGVTR